MNFHKLLAGTLIGITAAAITGCGGRGAASEAVNEVIPVYGNADNMAHGGLTEGTAAQFYYVWDGMLVSVSADGTQRAVLDENGAAFLCLTPETLYYVSRDESGQRGIYRRGTGGGERSLVVSADASFLYSYADRLYYLTDDGVCSVNADGTDGKILYAGDYAALLFQEETLLAENRDSGVTERLQPDGSTVLAADEAADESAVAAGMDMETLLAELDVSAIQDGADNAVDGQDGAQVDVQYRPLGWAGEWLLYEQKSYTPESMTDMVRIPEKVSLLAYDTAAQEEAVQIVVLLEEKSASDETTDNSARYAAKESFRLLLAQDESILQNEADGFFDALKRAPEEVTFLATEEREGYANRLIVNTPETVFLFQDFWNGVYCVAAMDREALETLEPLSDGSFLRKYVYRYEGVTLTSYEVIAFDGGCRLLVTDSCQHMELDLNILADQAGAQLEPSVKKDSYYAQGAFVTAQEWEAALADIMSGQLSIVWNTL